MSVSIPKAVASALRGATGKMLGVKSCTLVKIAEGMRGATASAGTNPTSTSYAVRGMIEVLTVGDVPQTLIQTDDRKIGIVGDSLPAGIVPSSRDKVTIVDVDGVSKTFRLVGAISGDGVGAFFEFQARL